MTPDNAPTGDTERRDPRLSSEQKDRILAQVAWEFQSGNLRPVHGPATHERQGTDDDR